MASESTSVTLTLVKGPLTHTIRGMTFRLNEPQHLAIDSSNQDIVERLKLDSNFRYEGPSKKKAKKQSSPPPPPEDSDDGEDSDEETSDDEDESEESESKSEEFSRASLRGLSKKELLKISKKLKVKGVDASMSRSAIVDAIIETQGAKG
jgi:hypothetical protein